MVTRARAKAKASTDAGVIQSTTSIRRSQVRPTMYMGGGVPFSTTYCYPNANQDVNAAL